MGRPLGKLVLAWLAGGTLVGAVLVSGTPAFACSCAPPEIERWVAEADGAFIGTWVDRSVVGGGSAAVTFRVERVLKGSFGPKAIVRTYEQSSACGLELLGSRRTGLLLRRAADRVWESDLCSMVSPEELLVIGKGHPPDPPSLRSARAGASRLWPSGSVC
jgi:hypothetical protein